MNTMTLIKETQQAQLAAVRLSDTLAKVDKSTCYQKPDSLVVAISNLAFANACATRYSIEGDQEDLDNIYEQALNAIHELTETMAHLNQRYNTSAAYSDLVKRCARAITLTSKLII